MQFANGGHVSKTSVSLLRYVYTNLHIAPGYWLCLKRGIVKNNLPLVCVSFELQIVQIPTYAQVGGVGLDIDGYIITI